MRRKEKAFTLIELLVVIAIIAVLLAVILPSLRLVKENTKYLVCKTNMHQIGLAMHLYSQSNNDRIVPGDMHGVTLSHNMKAYTIGHLFTANLLPEPTDDKGSAIYCPSDKNDWFHTPANPASTPLGVDRTWQSGWNKNSNIPVHCSYEFRDSLDGNWSGEGQFFPKCKGAKISKISRQVLLTEWLTPGYMEYQHNWRYNFLAGDGSVADLDERPHQNQAYSAASNPQDPFEVGITGICFYYGYQLGNRWIDYIPYDAADYILGFPEWKIPLVEGETTPPPLPWR